ncbi:MAG: hypothetical protein ACK51L_03515 [bacterium]
MWKAKLVGWRNSGEFFATMALSKFILMLDLGSAWKPKLTKQY